MKLQHYIKESYQTHVVEDNGELYFYKESFDEYGFLESADVWHNSKAITCTEKGEEIIKFVENLGAISE